VCVELTDERDALFYHCLVLAEHDFAALREEQALLVDFAAFPDMFVELLRLCVDTGQQQTQQHE
jgi:spindle assembly abnormal protein 6